MANVEISVTQDKEMQYIFTKIMARCSICIIISKEGFPFENDAGDE